MKTKLKLHFLLLTLLSLSGPAHAQGTAIGYQGRLNYGGSPATGLYNFIFRVFDVEAGGAALAPLVVRDAVPVTNGLFNVSLDFGPDIFIGPARWLEIGLRANEVDFVVTVLTPRTPLLPAPYAIFADKAGGVASGTLTADQLNSGGVPPMPGQFLSYDGGNFLWRDPAVLTGDVWSVLNNNAYYTEGKVGIGTASPLASLDVLGNWDGEQGALNLFGDRPSIRFTGDAGSDNRSWLMHLGGSPGDLLFYRRAGAGSWFPTLSLGAASGNVGIGTTTPASKLTVFTPSGGITRVGMEHTDGTVRLGTYVHPGSGGWLGTVSNHPLNFFYNDGLPSMTIGGGGISMVSGLGTLTVGSPNAESGLSIIRGGNRADVRFEGSTLKLVVGPVGGPPASTRGIAIDTFGDVGIGTDSPLTKLDVRGTTRTCVLTITGGCDLAEPFPLKDENISKGSVVVIDEEHPGRLMRSERGYDRRVAGIISGANGINPGITLQQEGALEGGQNVALSGRVYVLADATNGAIKPGDLLTTSDTPGHAMKVTEHSRAQGAILGKAMSGLKEGKGIVLVLVTLQ